MVHKIYICILIWLKLHFLRGTVLQTNELDLSAQLKTFEPCFIQIIRAEVYGWVSFNKKLCSCILTHETL